MFELEIETDNAAFDGDIFASGLEISRVLKTVANQIEGGQVKGKIRDINGNMIGKYELTD